MMYRFVCVGLLVATARGFMSGRRRGRVLWISSSLTSSSKTTVYQSLDDHVESLQQSLEKGQAEIVKTLKVTVAPSNEHRLGLIATTDIKKGQVMVAMPYDDSIGMTPTLAREVVLKDELPEGYDGWTGDTGLVALVLLNEAARTAGAGVALPKRSKDAQAFMESWVSCLPTPQEMTNLHPLLWSEDDQEVLQSSTTNKVYRVLDDIDEDASWLEERLWSKDREKFPASVGDLPCFSLEGYKWAMALVQSRSVFVSGSLRLLPLLDFCNHDDKGLEVSGGTMGTFGTTKGAELIANKSYKKGDEVFCSYGPKSAADYLLEHGFCPPQVWKAAVSELTFELDSAEKDRFRDDKLDILEFETYDLAPMDPVQSFDAVSEVGRDGEPDPAMMQFVRLCKLGGTDAFLLESIFRKEVWEFMSFPVSEQNELAVVDTIIDTCEKELDELLKQDKKGGGPELCKKLRESEIKALSRTVAFLQREKEALDLKEYYQERRLKDLGLDSEWTPEDDLNPDLGFGQTRAPGGADYDW